MTDYNKFIKEIEPSNDFQALAPEEKQQFIKQYFKVKGAQVPATPIPVTPEVIEPTGIMGKMGQAFDTVSTKPAAGVRNVLENMVQSMAGGKLTNMTEAFKTGFQSPETIPTMQDRLLKMAPGGKSTALNLLSTIPASTAGVAADFITNPFDMVTSLVGAGATKLLAKTKVGSNFLKTISGNKLAQSTGQKGITKIANQFDDAINASREEMYTSTDKMYKSIKGKIDISDIGDDIISKIGDVPKKIREKLTAIFDLIPKDEVADASVLRKMKEIIASDPKMKKSLYKYISPDDSRSVLKDIYHNANDSLGKLGGDDFLKWREEYKEFITEANRAQKLITKSGHVSESRLKKFVDFDTAEKASLEFMNQRSGGNMIRKLNNWRRAQELKKLAKFGVKYGSALAGAGAVGKYGIEKYSGAGQ